MYVGHSAVRRWVMGDAAYERQANRRRARAIAAIVDEAMRAGALGLSSSHAPTHLDLADRPVPSRLASIDELRALADVVGRYGRGSIAYAPESAVEGISADDRDLLIELAGRGGVPVDHPGPRRPLQGRRADQGLAGVEGVPRPLGRRGRAGVLAADDPAAQRAVHPRRWHLALRGRAARGTS